MKLNDIRKNDFVQLDFDNRFTIEQVKNVEITVTDFTSMKTAYGLKNIAIFECNKGKTKIEGWFYLTESLSHMLDFKPPFDVTITSTTSKAGKNYWTTNLKKASSSVSITELVDKVIDVYDVSPITTKYGTAYKVVAAEHGSKDKFNFLSNWEFLYNDLTRALESDDLFVDSISALLEQDPLVLKVITKKSKTTSHTYISYEDYDE